MAARGVVPAFDKLEAGNAGLGLGFELPAVGPLAILVPVGGMYLFTAASFEILAEVPILASTGGH